MYILTFKNILGERKRSALYSSETVAKRCSVKKVFLKISQNSQENTCVGVSFQEYSRPSGLQLYKKGTPTHVFFCEFCRFFKNLFCRASANGCFWFAQLLQSNHKLTRYSWKKIFQKVLWNLKKSTRAGVSFWWTCRSTGIFLGISQNCLEQLFAKHLPANASVSTDSKWWESNRLPLT